MPDFLMIGAMKAGTTTLFRWLGGHPNCCLPAEKEPAFFARDDRWSLGIDWYREQFPQGNCITGEASVAYTDPRAARVSAHRIASLVPDVRLIFVARHPLERARSHYIHQVQHGREQRTFGEAIDSDDSLYLQRSCYFSILQPYFNLFSRDQVAIVWFDEMFSENDNSEWGGLLNFLGLPVIPRPEHAYNRAVDRPRLSSPGRWLRDRGYRTLPPLFPRPLRAVARALLTSSQSPEIRRLISSAAVNVSGTKIDEMWEDVRRFLVLMGSDTNRWE